MNKHVGCVLARTKLSAVGCALARTNSIDAACVRRPRLLVGLAALDPPYGHGACEHAPYSARPRRSRLLVGLAALDPPYGHGACEHAPYSAARTRGGFTLVELLIVVVIIGLLGTMMIVALRGAAETAREAATKATIAKLHGIIMERYSGYLTRRVQVNTSGVSPKVAAQRRLDALRDVMRMEMPERWNDLTDPPVSFGWGSVPAPSFKRVYGPIYQNALTTYGATAVGANSHAECLYMIVASNPEDMEQFGQSEIGDTDGDSLPEFLDAWGQPIFWLRWAPGLTPDPIADPALPQQSDIQDRNAHDPFDPRRLQAGAFNLVPLIYSPGPDGKYGIEVVNGYHFNGDPFDSVALDIGEPAPGEPGAWMDNITNHYLEVR